MNIMCAKVVCVCCSDEEKKAMLEMIRQFEAGCMQDEEDLAQQDSTNQLAERLKSVDLGKVAFIPVVSRKRKLRFLRCTATY